jgi:hypothetical protein
MADPARAGQACPQGYTSNPVSATLANCYVSPLPARFACNPVTFPPNTC